MFKMILTILLIVVAVGVFIGTSFEKVNYDEISFKKNKKSFLSLIPLILIFVVNAVCVIPANTVGVKYSKLNGTSEDTMGEGVHIVMPFVDKIYEIDTTVQERTDEKVSIQTKDAQWIKANINVKYKVNKENAFKVYKGYKTLENLKKNIIGNYTQEALNQVCTKYNVIDVLGEKRNEFVQGSTEVLAEMLEKEGVTLQALTLKDIDAGKEIEKAISDEAVAKKKVETAKQDQEKAKTEAETKIIEAQGEADANKVLSESITDELIRMKEAEARLKHGWVTVKGSNSTAVVKE